MLITLKRPGTCADCGASLAVGTKARWYRNGSVYGLDCHEAKPRAPRAARSARRRRGYDSPGYLASLADPRGLYAPDGTLVARSRCSCEDYPCCGC